jgi:hypothetical protein
MMLLNNPDSPALDALNVRYIVAQVPLEIQGGRQVFTADGCVVYDISGRRHNVQRRNGSDFYPGWRQSKFQPETFRLGSFLTLCSLGLIGALLAASRRGTNSRN